MTLAMSNWVAQLFKRNPDILRLQDKKHLLEKYDDITLPNIFGAYSVFSRSRQEVFHNAFPICNPHI